MDSKVINRSVHGAYNPWPDAPIVERVYLRGLHAGSYGNAVGLGMADMIHPRLIKAMKTKPTFINSLTSNTLASIRTPANFKSDRLCLEALWPTVGKLDPQEITLCWIRDTQDLSLMAISANLRAEIDANPNLEIVQRCPRVGVRRPGRSRGVAPAGNAHGSSLRNWKHEFVLRRRFGDH